MWRVKSKPRDELQQVAVGRNRLVCQTALLVSVSPSQPDEVFLGLTECHESAQTQRHRANRDRAPDTMVNVLPPSRSPIFIVLQ